MTINEKVWEILSHKFMHTHMYKCMAHRHKNIMYMYIVYVHVATVYHIGLDSPRRLCRDGLVDFLLVDLVLVD